MYVSVILHEIPKNPRFSRGPFHFSVHLSCMFVYLTISFLLESNGFTKRNRNSVTKIIPSLLILRLLWSEWRKFNDMYFHFFLHNLKIRLSRLKTLAKMKFFLRETFSVFIFWPINEGFADLVFFTSIFSCINMKFLLNFDGKKTNYSIFCIFLLAVEIRVM